MSLASSNYQLQLNSGDYLKNNSYKIIKELGKGGFGVVYLVEDVNNQNKRLII